MDSLTQAALGGALGGVVLGPRLGRGAIALGALVATLPDLDVLMDYGDAVLNMTEHRGFSHSLLVLSAAACLLALLSQWVAVRFSKARQRGEAPVPLAAWASFYLLVLITHPLLDALTAYGTQLFWPLTTPPVAWPVVFIIDPFYSLALLGALAIAIWSGRARRVCGWGLAISCLYLGLAVGAKWEVNQRLAPVLAEQGLTQAPRLVQPAPFSILLWRISIADGKRRHEGLVSLLDSAPPALASLDHPVELERLALNFPRGQRLDWFAGPFVDYQRLPAFGADTGHHTLIATDTRLGFPGVHPFSFKLARQTPDGWQPLDVTEGVDLGPDLSMDTFRALLARTLGHRTALCPTDLVDPARVLASACPAPE